MLSPLTLRICCLAAMAPALTSEAATRAREKIPGTPAPVSTQDPVVLNGRVRDSDPAPQRHLGEQSGLDSNRTGRGIAITAAQGLVLGHSPVATKSHFVTLKQDLKSKLSDSNLISGDPQTPGIVSLASITSLTDLYKREHLISTSGTVAIPPGSLRNQGLLITAKDRNMNQPVPSKENSSCDQSSSHLKLNGGTSAIQPSKPMPLVPSAVVGRGSEHPQPSITSVDHTPMAEKLVARRTPAVAPLDNIKMAPQSTKPPQFAGLPQSTSEDTVSNQASPLAPKHVPLLRPTTVSTTGVVHSKGVQDGKGISSTQETISKKAELNTPSMSRSEPCPQRPACLVKSNMSANIDLTAESSKRQKLLQSRAERVLKRLRRLQCRQAISHVKQQFSGVVDHQHKTLPHPRSSRASGRMDLKTELLQNKDVKSMSTAALVSLVHKLQSSQPMTLRQHLAGLGHEKDEAQHVKLDEDLCAELDRVSGHLRSNLHSLETALDSDNTESSSGGESCDELEYDDDWDGKSSRPAIHRRSEWRWGRDRSAVASRWTWLQAQVSDLEYRIRQQNDIYRQIRQNKGAVVLGEPPPTPDVLARCSTSSRGPTSQPKTNKKLSPLEEKIANLQNKNQEMSPANVSSLLSNVDKQSCKLTQQLGNAYSPQASPSVTTGSSIAPVNPKTTSTPNGYVDPNMLSNCGGAPPEGSPDCRVSDSRQNHLPKSADIPTMSFDTSSTPMVDHTCQSSRCRPIRSYRKRKLLRTAGLHQINRKAARLSTVKCRCYPPVTPCAMCGGRYNNILQADPESQSVLERIALLDTSFHPVLSFPQDTQLSIHFESMMKTGEWQHKCAPPKPLKVLASDRRRARYKEHVRKYNRRLPKGASAAVLSSAKIRNKYDLKQLSRGGALLGSPIKSTASQEARALAHSELKIKKRKAALHAIDSMCRKNSMTGRLSRSRNSSFSASMSGTDGHGGSLKDALRRRRGESAFDINNIVIPYSIAASTRVEKLQYKEILTPKWREVDEQQQQQRRTDSAKSPTHGPEPQHDVKDEPQQVKLEDQPATGTVPPKDPCASPAIRDVPASPPASEEGQPVKAEVNEDEEVEDLSEEGCAARHMRCEISEKKRYLGLIPKNRRGRAQRDDSISGTMTPDPRSPDVSHLVMSSEPGLAASLVTPPLTPGPASRLDGGDAEEGSSSGIRRNSSAGSLRPAEHAGRRRSGSVSSKGSRSRSGSVSEERFGMGADSEEIISPWVKRTFPLTDDDYVTLHCEKPVTVEGCNTLEPTDSPGPGPGAGHHHQPADDEPHHLGTCVVPAIVPLGETVATARGNPASPGKSSTTSCSELLDDPDDPEWTVISERGSTGAPKMTLKLAKR